jgi:hypothetical protein
VVGVVAGLLALAIVASLPSRSHRINMESYSKISKGMSEADVINTLGVPHGQHYAGEAEVHFPFGPANSTGVIVTDHLKDDLLNQNMTLDGVSLNRKVWVGDEISLWITFDTRGNVIHKDWYPVYRRGWSGWMRQWLIW